VGKSDGRSGERRGEGKPATDQHREVKARPCRAAVNQTSRKSRRKK
jgi:hypothetical protein